MLCDFRPGFGENVKVGFAKVVAVQFRVVVEHDDAVLGAQSRREDERLLAGCARSGLCVGELFAVVHIFRAATTVVDRVSELDDGGAPFAFADATVLSVSQARGEAFREKTAKSEGVEGPECERVHVTPGYGAVGLVVRVVDE